MAITTIQASKATPTKGINYIKNKAALTGILNLDINQDFAKQMMTTAMLWNKAQEENSRKYYHTKISFDPKDWTKNGGTLTEKEALAIGLQLMKEFFPNHESVGVVHTDRNHLHFHGISNSVNLKTGKMVDMRKADYRKFKDRVQEICAERGLSSIDWRESTKQKRLTEKQAKEPIEETFAEKGLKSRNKVTWKDELRNIIDQAASTAKDLDEFKAFLEAQGVTLTRCTDKTISYKLGEHKACRGDSLGGDYTIQAIHSALNHNRTEPVAEQGKDYANITDKINNAAKKKTVINSNQYITKADREVFRSAGRQIGLKRAAIDEMCDNATQATYDDKKSAWDAYRQAQADYWEYYYAEKARLQKAFEERLAWKKSHRSFIENLYYNQHRGLMTSLFLLAVVLIKPDLIQPNDECIQALREEYAKLKIEMQIHNQQAKTWQEALKSCDSYGEKLKELDDRVSQVAANELQNSKQNRQFTKSIDYSR